jgi:hypothetical protein
MQRKFSGYVGKKGGRFFTTVDADSASGQPVLNVASTAKFDKAQGVVINPHGAREEFGTIISVQDGISITLQSNLTYTHTALQADRVKRVGRVEAFL